MTKKLSADRIGVDVKCFVCGHSKAPVGRSVPPQDYLCNALSCDGYYYIPVPGSLFPGESEEDFGYPVGKAGTTDE